MSIREDAVSLHSEGYNCAQCVLCSCSKYTGLDRVTSLSISGGFGGGVRCGEICGAISGAVMAIGVSYPFSDASDKASMMRIASLTKQCTSAFQDKYGAVRCHDLKRSGVSCDDLIAFGAYTAENIIMNKNKVED